MNVRVPKKLLPIFSTKKRYIVLRGGRGSAKSHSVAAFLLIKALQSKVRILCTREIQNSIKDSVWKLLCDKISEYKWDAYFEITDKSIVCKKTGSEFIFKGLLRNINDIKSIEGIDYCWVEEAQSVSRRSLEVLIPTIRKDSSQIIFTYNPTNEDDPVHVDYTLADRDDCLKIEVNWSDNPWFPEVLRAEKDYTKKTDIDKYYHIWEGQCVKHSEAQIYYGKWAIEDFEAESGTVFYFGADWGFSQDPTSLVRFFIKERRLYIDQEIYKIGLDIDKIPGEFATIEGSSKYSFKADSARPDTISYVRQRGFPLLRPAKKGPGSIEDGIAFLKSFEKIVIHPRCKNAIDEFRNYCYKIDPATGYITNKIVDKHNHIHDSLRYGAEDLMKNKTITAGRSLAR